MEIQFVHPLAMEPFRDKETDAGYDIYTVENVLLSPNDTCRVSTGICISAPPGYYYTIEGRSSMNKAKIFVVHRPIIDSTFCDELYVWLRNDGCEPYQIKEGDRIAQILIHEQYDAKFVNVDKFSPEYNQRGRKGFGSTGA